MCTIRKEKQVCINMAEELNMLAEIESEGAFDFDTLESKEQVETPAESQSEEEREEETVNEETKEDDKTSKQSRNWKQMREELAEERAARAERDKLLEEERAERLSLKERLDAIEKGSDTSVEQPEFLKQMVGDNADVAKSFQEYEEKLLEKAEARILQRQQNEATAKQKQIDDANNFIESQISKIEKEAGVELKPGSNERNELLKTVYEYAPTDANNNYDFGKGWKILQALKQGEKDTDKVKTEARKIIADSTTSKNTGGKETKNYVTSNDIRKAGGWRNFINN